MPALGLRIIGREPEDRQHRLADRVADRDRQVQRRVIDPRWARCIQ